MSTPPSPYTAYSVSWNLTQRCNLECAHCYMSAHAGADTRGELSTAECRRVMDEIAAVNPNVFLILTGGEPLLRRDIWDLAACAADKKFTTVFGTNGVLLREREARLMREHGVLGASISLDSTDRVKHDAFRRLPGAWGAAGRELRGSVVHADRPRRGSADPCQVRAALSPHPLAAQSVLAAAEELRPRLMPGG